MKRTTDKYIDISIPVWPGVVHWPGVPAIEFHKTQDMTRGDMTNDTTVRMNVHTGTHVDAPFHFFANGLTVDQLSMDDLIGPALVVYLSSVQAIDVKALKSLKIPASTRRLLFKTCNSDTWQKSPGDFDPNFVAMTAEAAQWVVKRGIKLVGIDYLSVQRFDDGPQTHQILLGAGLVVLEGLNLGHVSPGKYDLICLPIRLVGLEGAWARAILRRRS